MPREKKEASKASDIEHLNLPKIENPPRKFTGNNNQSKQLNLKDGTRKGGQKSGQAPVEHLESYKNWMTVQGLKKAFIAAYSECGNIIIACNITGIHPRNVTAWRRSDEVFSEDFDYATDMAVSLLEQEARRRALDGSDRLLEFLLKSLRPEIYRERYEFKQEVSTDYIIDISPQSEAENPYIASLGVDVSPTELPGESS